MSAKTLVILIHPYFEKSVVNRRLVAEYAKHPDRIMVHHLESVYPDGRIDVQAEQALMDSHGSIVLQFPIFWFNCPPLLKTWLDQVWCMGWAFGRADGGALKNRPIGVVTSAGVEEKEFSHTGGTRHPMSEVLSPFECSTTYVGAQWRGFYAVYGCEAGITAADIEEDAGKALDFVLSV